MNFQRVCETYKIELQLHHHVVCKCTYVLTIVKCSDIPSKVAAIVEDFDFSQFVNNPKETEQKFPRYIQFAIAACKQAIDDAGFTTCRLYSLQFVKDGNPDPLKKARRWWVYKSV